jgi:hypothetical protein
LVATAGQIRTSDIEIRKVKIMTICKGLGNFAGEGRRGMVASLILLLVTALVGPAAKAQEVFDPSAGTKPIEGSLIFSVKALNGSYYFTAVASFTAGGVFLATGSNDRIIPASPLYGTWKYKGRDRFNATANFFGFDSTGNAIAMLHIVQGFELKPNGELVGVGEFSVCDAQGESCQRTPQTDFSVTARRIIAADLTELTLPHH